MENELQVVASAKQAAGQVRDEELEREVKKALDTPEFKDITIEVKNGVVRLTGTIPTGAQRLEAAVIVRAIPGVRAVEDDLRLAACRTLIVLARHACIMRRAGGVQRNRQFQNAFLHKQRGAAPHTTRGDRPRGRHR